MVVENEKKLLEANGNRVWLYSRSNMELKEMSRLQKLFLPLNTVFNFKTKRDIKKLICDNDIDIVHVHNTLSIVSPSVYYGARECNVPVVQTIHNFRLLCPGAALNRDNHICEDCITKGLFCAVRHSCYRGSKIHTLGCVISLLFHRMTGIYGKINYICLTEFNKKKLLELKQIKENRVYVKPNFAKGGDSYLSAEERNGAFIFAGRLDKLKGVDIMLNAWKKMGDNAPRLIVCGTGPMEEWCRTFAEENNLSSVELRGFVPNEEVKKLIAKSKALILPTRWYEGFPMSIAESFSVGTPVVCSDLGNAGSLVREGVTGSKFDYTSQESLIEAVFRLMKYENIHSTTFAEYKEKYTEEKNYSQLVEIYDKVIKGKV